MMPERRTIVLGAMTESGPVTPSTGAGPTKADSGMQGAGA